MKTYDIRFTANLLNSVIKEGSLTVKANDPQEAKFRGALLIRRVLLATFKSEDNYDYSIWSVEERGETIDNDADQLQPQFALINI